MLFFCSITIMAQAQQKFEISGIVQDETGQPVPGVSVYVKDKNRHRYKIPIWTENSF